MNKKIAILANNSGGLYGFRGELIAELIKMGCEVTALTPFDTNIEDLEKLGAKLINTPIDRRGINPFKDLGLLCCYYKCLRQIKPDMVITYTIKPNVYGGMLARWMRIPYVANITGLGTTFQKENVLRKIVIFLYKVALKKAKVVFFENSENRGIFVQEKIVEENRTYLLNGAGVNLEKYSFRPYPSGEETRFLFIGRVMKEKGVDELFEAAIRLKREYDNVHFDIVGPLEDNYQDKIHELVNEGIIEYHGYQLDVRPYIERCHCFVLPSYHEGMANTLLEAGAMGRPLITSRIHGCMEAVVEEKSGILCVARNADSLYETLKMFIQKSDVGREIMGQESRKHVQKVFNKKKIVKETINQMTLMM